MKKNNTREKIIEIIEKSGQSTVDDITSTLNVSRQLVHRHIARLVEEGILTKKGSSPRVFYVLNDKKDIENITNVLEDHVSRVIKDNFLMITPSGERKEGITAFIEWCEKRGENFEKTAKEYAESIGKYNKYKENSLIGGMHKMKTTFKDVFLDNLFYLDFYSIERFGKTKLGQLLLYAKQSQDRNLIKELVIEIKPKIEQVIEKYKIQAVGFIPPTVKREIQLMKEVEKQLSLNIPSLNLVKIKTGIAIPQKTLTKLEDRVENAKNTIFVDENRKYERVVLIDDALGSGATLNEVAKKIKNQNIAKEIIGVAITGSFSGFEVISEV